MENESRRSFKWWVPVAITAGAAIIIVGVAYLIHSGHKTSPSVAPTTPLTKSSSILQITPATCDQTSDELYLVPSTTTVNVGSTVDVTMCANSGSTGVNAVESDISYAAENLSYVGVSSKDSGYTIEAPTNATSGSVKIARANIQPLTGQQPVAVIRFKAIKAGSVSLTYDTTSALLNSTTNTSIVKNTSTTNISVR